MPTTRKWNDRRSVLVAVVGLALAMPGQAQIYRWTDSTGKTHYGDKPPDDVQKREVKVHAQSFDGAPQTDDWAAILRRPAGARNHSGLTMFSATWCGPCKRAKAYLAQKGTSYRDVDIDASEENNAEFKSFGGGGVPLFIAGNKRMRGFSAEDLDRLIAAKR